MREEACGPRHGEQRRDRAARSHRWGHTRGKIGFHGGRVELERPTAGTRDSWPWQGRLALPSWERAVAEDAGSGNGR